MFSQPLVLKIAAVVAWALSLLAVSHNPIQAQQIGVGTPFSTFGDSTFERMGVNFGFSLPGGQGPGSRVVGLLPNGQFTSNGNIVFSQGGFGSAIPAFGGYDPNASGRFGFGTANPSGGGFSLGFEMGKGSNRTFTNTTPQVMVQNGFGGSIVSGQLSPFVTGLIPFSGGSDPSWPPDNGVTRAYQSGQLNLSRLGNDSMAVPLESSPTPTRAISSAETSESSVVKIKQQKARQRESEKLAMAAHLQAVDDHLAVGRVDLARLELNRAIALEKDPVQKQSLKHRLKKMK